MALAQEHGVSDENTEERYALKVSDASAGTGSPFVHCVEGYGFQRRLAWVLAEVRRRLEVPTVELSDLFALS